MHMTRPCPALPLWSLTLQTAALSTRCAQAGHAQARACVFDKHNGLGAFATLPLTDASFRPAAQAGLRFSSPELSLGFSGQPFQCVLSKLWVVRPCFGQN